MSADGAGVAGPFASTPPWYKDAAVPEVDAGRSMDGNGDLAGLPSRLDYLVDLGVTYL